jgi:hypothetical protein
VAGRQAYKRALAGAIEERIAAHDLQPVFPPERLVVLVTAPVNGLAVEELTEPGGMPDELPATALVALIDPSAWAEPTGT